ncbi:MAG TPA: hypothetical protein VM328_07710, partial [Fimbriimonadaceae bacterium]|nr:hypothetical protein [Fimbriimonadaceae bacterium]
AGQNDRLVPFATQKSSIERIKLAMGAPAEPQKKAGFLSTFLGKGGIELQTYVTDGDHAYPGEASKAMVEFFKRL